MTTPTQPEQTKNGPAPAIGESATPVKKARVVKRRAQVAPPKAKPAPTAAKRSGSRAGDQQPSHGPITHPRLAFRLWLT